MDRLDELIRQAGRVEPTGFVAPADEVVRRYLLGAANARERRLVHSAVEQSALFRRELPQMAEAVDQAADAGIARHFVQPQAATARRSWYRRPVVFLPLAAAAAVILMVMSMRSPDQTREWTLVVPNVEVERLIAMTTRGAGGGQVSPTEMEAALAQMRRQLEWVEGAFRFRAADPAGVENPGETEYRLRLSGPDGNALGDATIRVPSDSVAIWLLQFPARNLVRFEARPGDNLARLDSPSVTGGCVVWTYTTQTGYRALPAFTFGRP